MTMSLIASGTRSWRRGNWGDEPRRPPAFMHETNTFSRVKTDMPLIQFCKRTRGRYENDADDQNSRDRDHQSWF